MQAKGVSHIAVCVADLDRSLHFYRDLLGLMVRLHTTQNMARRPGAESAEMYQWPRESRTVANVWFDDPPWERGRGRAHQAGPDRDQSHFLRR